MAGVDEITGELRTLVAGVERAQSLTAAADRQAQDIAVRAAGAGFTAVAAGMARVRASISTVQGGSSALATRIGETTTATATVPREATPQETIAALAPVGEGVTAIREATTATINQVVDAQRMVTTILQGGQPNPLLQALDGVKQVLVLLVQRTTAAQQAVEATIRPGTPARISGKLSWAGGFTPTSPSLNTGNRSGSTAVPEILSAGWSRPLTGVPGGRPTGPRTRIDPDVDDSTRRSLDLENDCADTLAARGYRVHQNLIPASISDAWARTGDDGDPEKSPDYLVEGHVFDCYSPSARTPARNIWSQLREKIDRHAVVNLKDRQGDLTALHASSTSGPSTGSTKSSRSPRRYDHADPPATVRRGNTMGVEFRLTLAGALSLADIAALTATSPDEQPTPANPHLFSANLHDQRGYAISVYSGTNGYYWAEADNDSPWEWEPTAYVNITFDMRTDDLVDKGVPHMTATVARVLAGGDEDAALIQDGNHLLLTRTNGTVRKHRPRWWSHYHLDHLIT